MAASSCLLDTHALVFWANRQEMSDALLDYLDRTAREGGVMASSLCFWEIALLVKKQKIELDDIDAWHAELAEFSGLLVVHPSVADMIASTRLPDLHRDPFDRVLIAQARGLGVPLVSRDPLIGRYDVATLWAM